MSELKPKEPLEILWTPKMVADYFSLSVRTVYCWISEGKVIDPSKIVRIGNRVRIHRSEVERIAGKIRSQIKQS